MPLIVGGGIAVAKTVVGLVNNAKAKKEAKRLQQNRPQYQVNPLAQQELDLSESELSKGMSSRAESAYNNALDRQYAGSIDAITRYGGSVNNIGDIFNESEAGRQRLAQLQDQMRLAQIQNLTRSRQNMVEQQDKAFEFNKWRPWADKSQANAAARQGAQNMIWSGLDTFTGLAMGKAQENYDKNQYNSQFATQQTQTQRPSYSAMSAEVPYPQSQMSNMQPQSQNQDNFGYSYEDNYPQYQF